MKYIINKIYIESMNTKFVDEIRFVIDTYFPDGEASIREVQEFARNTKIDKMFNRNNFLTFVIINENGNCKIKIKKVED